MSEQSELKRKMRLHVYIVTPYEIFFDGLCEMLVFQASDGEMGVMHRHSPQVVALMPGELRIKEQEQWRLAFVSNGYVQIEKDYSMVVCNSAEWAENIDEARARKALERAEKRLTDEADVPDIKKRAAQAVRRANKRLSVIEKYKAQQADKNR